MDEVGRLLQSASGEQWKRIGARQHHGICLPLFSLHSIRSCGIGEFPDLLPLLAWCPSVGIDLIQLLPLNDTGIDTSPYSALSAFALNPIHLGLAQLPYLPQTRLHGTLPHLQQLTHSQRIDYPKVYAAKMQFLREYYGIVGNRISQTDEYRQFVDQHDWLQGYGLFKALKIHRSWQLWEDWDESIRNPSRETYQELVEQFADDIAFHIFLQYLCFQQWREVWKQAEAHHVFLKGDIPILINRESADVWLQRSIFMPELSAGAPPDMYAAEGQNWGFPIYNWGVLENQDYAWWKKRLHVAEELYHIYRIDHIVGFFRIWAIPQGKQGHEGHFEPWDEATWIEHGSKIMLMMLKNSKMLPIGEDLGTVPPPVRARLNELGICGTKVMRWERMWNEDKRFIPYAYYPVASLTTVSTHDSETLQQWWRNNEQEARAFAEFKSWDYQPELSLERHKQILRDSNHTASLFHINLLQEYLAQVPNMTWPLLEDERINIPGVISDRNWSYRFKPSIEAITTSAPLGDTIRDAIR